MAIDFPDSPSNGQAFTSNNKTWVFDGTSWNITSGTNSVADGAITTAKVADNAVTQTKLAASLSAVTVTTSANRNAAVPSPFTGQLVFLTDTKKMQVWDGSLWLNITLAPPEPPTSLSATALSTTSISVAFTAGGANGSPITNYKYALSTNGGSTYGAFTALNPADALTPITISGLTAGTTYHVKLKAVNDMGDSVESSATSVGTLSTPDAPTGLSASNPTLTTIDISFTAGAQGGSAISNYQYALSTNGGSSYGAFTALNPADATSPITITGLTHSTSYYIKLKAVNNDGAGAESSAIAATTGNSFTVDYLVVAGGGQAGTAGGGGAGGLRSTVSATGGGGALESPLNVLVATNYTVTVGAGSGGYTAPGGTTAGVGSRAGVNGSNSVFHSVTSIGGGGGGAYYNNATTTGLSGGSGGGGGWYNSVLQAGGTGTTNQGYAGGSGGNGTYVSGGGGGAGAVGGNSSPSGPSGNGGNGVTVAITGSSVTYAGGGGGGAQDYSAGNGGSGGGGNGSNNTAANANSGNDGAINTGGGGGGMAISTGYSGGGGSGVVILRYPSSLTITIGAGLTTSHINEVISGGYKYTRFTVGSGNVSWS